MKLRHYYNKTVNDNDLKQISNLLDEKLTPIKKTLDEHGLMLKHHGNELGQHGTILRSLKKDQDTMLNMLDTEQMQ